RLAGLIGLSGYLPLRARFAQERHPSNQDTPIFMAHGVSDPVVPFAAGRDSRDMLQQAGYAVDWHEYPMQHNISQQEIADVSRWLQRILG
ncbi:carboxylesterase, partial [Acinetobacter baumannii]